MGECILHHADGTKASVPFGQVPVKIGRGAEAQLRIDDEFVSRTHCEVTVEGDRVVIRDSNSHNGTLVNGQRVQETTLSTGDKIKLGETDLTFQLDARMVPSQDLGGQMQRDVTAIFRIPPTSTQKPAPAETVRIPLPQSTPPQQA